MKLEFYKYHGTGNDFIMIDNRAGNYRLKNDLIEALCHRNFGIGADGLILLNSSSKYEFSMRYFNADGNEGSMCGNGGRCLIAFAVDLGMACTDTIFGAIDGEHHGIVTKNKGSEVYVRISMHDVTKYEHKNDHFFIETGSPHHIQFADDLKTMDVVSKGRAIRYSNEYKEKGTNVDFVEVMQDSSLFVRTYERGVEDETLSCGTGVTASAIAWSIMNPAIDNVNIKTLGGELTVTFNRKGDKFTDIWLEGPATFVYKGMIDI
jgi:diaminopimelate epimerase